MTLVTLLTPSALGAPVAFAAPAALAALLAPVARAEAQVISLPRRAQREPRLWVSGGAALFTSQLAADAPTGAALVFRNDPGALQYRAAAELALRNQASIGVSVAQARASLRYLSLTTTPPAGTPACAAAGQGCAAHVDVRTVHGFFRVGGGQGLHQVIEVGAGVTQYADLQARDAATRLPPPGSRSNLTGMVGYGVGYGLSTRLQATLVQDFGLVLHKGGLPEGVGRSAQQRVTRLGVRYGLGSRSL